MGERKRELAILLLGDITVFILSLLLTLTVRYATIPGQEVLEMHLGPFLLLACVWVGVFYIAGLYDKHTTLFKSLLFTRIFHTQIVNILLGALLFWLVPLGIAPKTNLVIYLLVSVAFVSWWRIRLYPLLSPKRKQKALLIANGQEAEELYTEVNENDRYSYGFVKRINSSELKSDDLRRLVTENNIDIIVADTRTIQDEQILSELFALSFERFQLTFFDFCRVYENTFDRMPLSAISYEWFLDNVSQSKKILFNISKRGVDILGSSLLGIVFCILLPFIVLAIKLESRGDVFITQERYGQYKKRVRVYKLRTMTKNRSASSTWTDEDAKQGNQVTKVGAFLRKTSLDEVPQVWNILKGEMSLIGPRNDILGLAERSATEIPFYTIRYFVKPGISGWAQTHQIYQAGNISPQSIEETRMRLAYDLYYVKNRSFLLDMEIALRTVKTLLSRFGINIQLFR